MKKRRCQRNISAERYVIDLIQQRDARFKSQENKSIRPYSNSPSVRHYAQATLEPLLCIKKYKCIIALCNNDVNKIFLFELSSCSYDN